MLRGNHECRQLTSFFNFKDECKYLSLSSARTNLRYLFLLAFPSVPPNIGFLQLLNFRTNLTTCDFGMTFFSWDVGAYKYTEELYDAIMTSFDHIPLAAMVNKAFFCVHGGLSPDVQKLSEIDEIQRGMEIPREGPMCDLLWSDPYEETDGQESEAKDSSGWFGYNATRQCSYVYGVEAVKSFLRINKLTSIIRAHEAQVDGYKMHMVNKTSGIPRVITIFSAPNYCDVYKNKAACLKFDAGTLNIKQVRFKLHRRPSPS